MRLGSLPADSVAPATILPIESDALLCEMLRYHLTHEGYTYFAAHTAADGAALAHSSSPDLILLAITLSDMPGISCCSGCDCTDAVQ